MTPNEIMNNIKESINNVEDLKGLNEVLGNMHPSDVYSIINDCVNQNIRLRGIINDAKKNDVKTYQEYQHIKMEATRSYKHDMQYARNIDVDKALTRMYKILLRMIGLLNQIVIKQGEAINKIEEHLELDITQFGGDADDTTGNGDV